MSKICLIGDTHIGCKSNSPIMHDYFQKFYQNVLFPYLKKHNITTVIQEGDLMDNKKSTGYYSLGRADEYLFTPMNEHVEQFYCLIGNHDICNRNNLEYNAPSIHLKPYKKFSVVDKPKTIQIYGKTFDIIPWICSENEQEIFEFIANSTSDYLVGHLEIKGIHMNKSHIAEEGLEQDLFSKYKRVFSGHYHTRSVVKNIVYTGIPNEIDWSDCQDIKGVCILNTDTDEIEFLNNPYKLFHKINYNDEYKDYSNINFDEYRESFVRIFIKNKTRPIVLEKLISNLEAAGIHELKIIENTAEYELSDESLLEIQTEDTLGLLHSIFENIECERKDDVKALLNTIYNESIALQ